MSTPMKFTHLHVHSHYSLLDGLAKIDDLVEKAKSCGMDSLALTDHGVMYGAVEFYQKCKKAGIKPIIGVEFYVAPNGRLKKRARVDEERYHLIVLAKNNQGYKNLLKLTSLAHLEGFYYKPRVDLEILKKYSEGLVATTACLQGEIPKLIVSGKKDKAIKTAKIYEQIYGKGNFYLEVQYHPSITEQKIVNDGIFEISRETGIPCTVANDIHYLESSDAEAQDILLCLQTKKKLEDTDRMSMMGEDFSFLSAEQMADNFSEHPEVISNTQKIAEMCNLEIELGEIKLPHFDVPNNMSPEAYLEKACWDGIGGRYGTKKISNKERAPQRAPQFAGQAPQFAGQAGSRLRLENRDDDGGPSGEWLVTSDQPSDASANGIVITEQLIKDRLNYELGVIKKTGFASYFLIVQDFVNWAKGNGIVVGPGRGSAAGSIVSYLLGITDIDPLKYDLLFERFLNPERISMPDIDLDFADTRRDEVIKYVSKKYGKNHVSQIITFGTMAARAALRDVGRVLNISYTDCDKVAKMVPLSRNLDEAILENPEFREIYENNQEIKKLIDTAKKLEGVARHASTHACGVVITKEESDNYVPLQYDSKADEKTVVSQYSMKPIEDLGLLKMDFLGLKNLTIMENTLKLIKYNYDIKIAIDNIPLKDPKTFKLLQSADTTGVFQLESSGMKRYLKQLKPTEIEDIIAMVALYRPGPMEWIPDYIDGKHGIKKLHYLHPKLAPILEKTYGVAIYQEQVLKIARDLAGFTLGEADILRKAVGKKIKDLLAEQKHKFIEGCKKNGIDEEIAIKVFTFIEPFAGYGFNRSHAACYAMIAYQTAYLKANFPKEFMASLLTSDQHDTDRIAIETEECRDMGIKVLPPDINESYKKFSVVNQKIDTKPLEGSNNFGQTDKKNENAKNKYVDKTKNEIRFGLLAIKNVGENIVEKIVEERRENGPYQNLEDFLQRVRDKDLNKKSLESLIKSGTLDRFGDRNQLLNNIETILNYSKNIQKEIANKQANLFGSIGQTVAYSLTLQESETIDKKTKLSWEKELLGIYVSEHPFREFEGHLRNITKKINELNPEKIDSESNVKIAGVVTNIKKIITKANEPMLFVKIEDTSGTIETLVFPKTLKTTTEIWQEGEPVAICGRLSDKDGTAKILCSKVWKIEKEKVQELIEEIKNYNGYNGNGYGHNGNGRYYGKQTSERAYTNYSANPIANEPNNNAINKINVTNGSSPAKKIEIIVPTDLTQEKSVELKTLIKQNEGGEYKVCFSFPNKETGISKKIITNSCVKLDDNLKQKIKEITGVDLLQT